MGVGTNEKLRWDMGGDGCEDGDRGRSITCPGAAQHPFLGAEFVTLSWVTPALTVYLCWGTGQVAHLSTCADYEDPSLSWALLFPAPLVHLFPGPTTSSLEVRTGVCLQM